MTAVSGSTPEENAIEPRQQLRDRLLGPLEDTGIPLDSYREDKAWYEALLNGIYAYPSAATAAAKISVSEHKRKEQQRADEEESQGEEMPAGKPAWISGTGLEIAPIDISQAPTGLTGAERGTAIHAVFRYLDLDALERNPSEGEVAEQIHTMQSLDMLTPEEEETVVPLASRYLTFAASPLGKALREADRKNRVYREIPFTLLYPAAVIHTDRPADGFSEEDATLVQGIIDLWFEEEDGVTLIDFKSDRLEGSDADIREALTRRYRLQLTHYAEAIERTTDKTVSRRVIWLFDRERAYEIL